MKAEDKSLLLKDLCARLLYGVQVKVNIPYVNVDFNKDYDYITNLQNNCILTLNNISDIQKITDDIKPYLRPLSSMTEKEKEELLNLLFDKEAKYFYIDKEGLIDGKTSYLMKEGLNYPAFCTINVETYTDYLNAHHFDWRTDSNGKTLIEKGLALEAPEGMYKYLI